MLVIIYSGKIKAGEPKVFRNPKDFQTPIIPSFLKMFWSLDEQS